MAGSLSFISPKRWSGWGRRKADEPKERQSLGEDAYGESLRAFVWLTTVEEDLALRTIRLLDEEHIRLLGEVAAKTEHVAEGTIAKAHRSFSQKMGRDASVRLKGKKPTAERLTALLVGGLGRSQALRLLPKALASSMRSRDKKSNQAAVFSVASNTIDSSDALQEAEAELVAQMLLREHPQVSAAILASVPAPRASAILSEMPHKIRPEILSRLADIDRVPMCALREVAEVFSEEIALPAGDDKITDGKVLAAEILNEMEDTYAESLLWQLSENGASMADSIRCAMFAFEDLLKLDRRGFQILLKEIRGDQLLLALKTATPELRSRIYAALSHRAATMLKEDFEGMAPARLSDVRKAQRTICEAAVALRAAGQLRFSAGDEELV